MLHEWLCDLVLSPGLDFVDDPPRSTRRDALQPQHGTLIRSGRVPHLNSFVSPRTRYTVSRGVQTTESRTSKSAILGLPVEVLSHILSEAVLVAMLPDDGSWGDIAIDCLRPDYMTGDTRLTLPGLGSRFASACTSCMLVCRTFFAIVMPLSVPTQQTARGSLTPGAGSGVSRHSARAARPAQSDTSSRCSLRPRPSPSRHHSQPRPRSPAMSAR